MHYLGKSLIYNFMYVESKNNYSISNREHDMVVNFIFCFTEGMAQNHLNKALHIWCSSSLIYVNISVKPSYTIA